MGINFAALIRYDGPGVAALNAIAALEANTSFPALQKVIDVGREERFAFVDYLDRGPLWRSRIDWEGILACRPILPALDMCLDLPSDFSLTFGKDAIGVCHTLRWPSFGFEPVWRSAMLDAVRLFSKLFDARDCVITNDENPAMVAFLNGRLFAEALEMADESKEGEVRRIDDLFIDEGSADEIAFAGPNDEYFAIPIYDTHGYFRLVLGDV